MQIRFSFIAIWQRQIPKKRECLGKSIWDDGKKAFDCFWTAAKDNERREGRKLSRHGNFI
jgi:hypothetical protein